MLERRWSPEQISARLAAEFPGRPKMRVSHETIYQSLYVQGRGALRRELASVRCGPGGRCASRGARTGERRGQIPGMVNISERPAEAADRAVPGHWEGDLLIGAAGKSAFGTLVERTTRFTLLVPLPERHDAPAVAEALTPVIAGLPAALRRSLTWDQGREMRRTRRSRWPPTARSTSATRTRPGSAAPTRTPTGCCASTSPRAPTWPGTARRTWPRVAGELNGRPRKTLGWKTPAEALAEILDRGAA